MYEPLYRCLLFHYYNNIAKWKSTAGEWDTEKQKQKNIYVEDGDIPCSEFFFFNDAT